MAISTQWRFTAPGDGTLRRTGLDYSGVGRGFDLAGLAMTPDLWREVQIIEYGAIAASNDEGPSWP